MLITVKVVSPADWAAYTAKLKKADDMVTEATPAPPATLRPATGLWSWITTVDHKRIGILYLVTTFFFFAVGGLMALVIRLQLEHANNTVVSAESYDRLFTMHGTTMIFLFVVPVMAAFGNYLVPLQIGARDMAFPRLNALSYWLLLFGGLGHVLELRCGAAAPPTPAGRPIRRCRCSRPAHGHRPVDRRPARPRHLVADRGDQLHLHDPQHARARHAADADAALHLDDRHLRRS